MHIHMNKEADRDRDSDSDRYRDKYIFLDTLTKIPTPKTFQEMNDANQLPYTKEQLINLRDYLNSLEL